MTVTALSYYQAYFNGLTMGAGTPYSIQNISGLKDLPPIRSQDDDRGYFDGSFSGNDFLSGRTITINLIVLNGNGNSAQQNANILKTALMFQKTGTQPFQFQLSPDEGLKFVNGRVRGQSILVDQNFSYGYIVAQFKIFCPDPRIYDNTQLSLFLSAGTPLGRGYPRTYPISYGGGSNTAQGVIANAGNATTYPVITITGPAVNPSIGNFSTGQAMAFNVTLAATDVLVIDLQARTITLNGNPARNLLTGASQWFSALAGNSSYYFTATGTTVLSGATVTWYNAYL